MVLGILATVLLTACGSGSKFDSLLGNKATNPSTPTPAAVTPPPVPPPAPSTGAPRGIPSQSVTDLPEGDSTLANLGTLIDSIGLRSRLQRGDHGVGIKIAVLDNGFAGLNHSLGQRLPPSTQLAPSPLDNMADTTHGVKLAEIVYGIASGSPIYNPSLPGPAILLFNTNGFTNFQAAIAGVIAAKVDIVLYAQVWEYGGNFDGHGFIDREVKKATDAGIIWVNAAGNYGQSVVNVAVTYDAKAAASPAPAAVALPNQGKYVRFTVPQNKTPVRVVLAWNDFAETKNYMTPEDLDLVIEDSQHHEVGAGRLRQSGENSDTKAANFSAYAREIVELNLDSGSYYARVDAISRNFDSYSRLRLSFEGEGLVLLDRSVDNTVAIPADMPDVLTVGASDVDYSGFAATIGGTSKPDVQVPSAVSFSDGEKHLGTSSASAIAAGGLAVYLGRVGKQTRSVLGQRIKNGSLSVTKNFKNCNQIMLVMVSCLPALSFTAD